MLLIVLILRKAGVLHLVGLARHVGQVQLLRVVAKLFVVDHEFTGALFAA